MAISSGVMLAVSALGLAGCMTTMAEPSQTATIHTAKTQTVTLAGGCFWCLDAQYRLLKGVSRVVSGYAGGTDANPSYEEVCMGTTGHAETVQVTFDPSVISEADLLRVFFTIHDPTTLNRQGPDEGTQYRSAIFYRSDEEKALAQRVIAEIEKAKIWNGKIVTSLEPLKTFYPAEDYHQDYFAKFEKASAVQKIGMNSGYCRIVVDPKVRKFKAKFAKLLK